MTFCVNMYVINTRGGSEKKHTKKQGPSRLQKGGREKNTREWNVGSLVKLPLYQDIMRATF